MGMKRTLWFARPGRSEIAPRLLGCCGLALFAHQEVGFEVIERLQQRLARRGVQPGTGLFADLRVDRQDAVDDGPAEWRQPQRPDAPVGQDLRNARRLPLASAEPTAQPV